MIPADDRVARTVRSTVGSRHRHPLGNAGAVGQPGRTANRRTAAEHGCSCGREARATPLVVFRFAERRSRRRSRSRTRSRPLSRSTMRDGSIYGSARRQHASRPLSQTFIAAGHSRSPLGRLSSRYRAAVAPRCTSRARVPRRPSQGRAFEDDRRCAGRQAAFRQELLQHFGPICAFSGPVPESVLDAAHLYS